jgi:hypothetical protein
MSIGRPVPVSVQRRMAQWPIHEVLIPEDWQTPCTLLQVLVSRRSPQGDLVAGLFLVDLGCLGLKNGFLTLVTEHEYGQIVSKYRTNQNMVACSPDLAAKILLVALEYADSLGFQPHPDVEEALPILQGADSSAGDEQVPIGDGSGKPFYCAGPLDNVKRVLLTLDRTCGEGNYELLIGGPVDPEL